MRCNQDKDTKKEKGASYKSDASISRASIKKSVQLAEYSDFVDLFFKGCVVEKFLDEVDVREKHATTAVTL